jgi:lipid-A-disaccharide synthase-like uncharacterized protein
MASVFPLTYIWEICSHQQTSAITESVLKLLQTMDLRDKITVLCMVMTALILLSKLNILLYDNIQTHSNKQKQLFNITHRSTTSTLQHIWT